MFEKIKWFLFYRNIIRKNKNYLLMNHNLKIDWVNRMYKTYTLSNDDVDEVKQYGNIYIEKLLEKDRAKIEETLINLNIHQFVGLMAIEPLNTKQIGIIFRFKYFDTAKIANKFIWIFATIITMLISYLIVPKIISIFIGLIIIFVIYLITRLLIIKRVSN